MPKSESNENRSSARHLSRVDYSRKGLSAIYLNAHEDQSKQQPKKRTNEREIVGLKKTVDFMANSMMKLQQVIKDLVEDKSKENIIKEVKKGNRIAKKPVLEVELGMEREQVISSSSLGKGDAASVKEKSILGSNGKGVHRDVGNKAKEEGRHVGLKGVKGEKGTHDNPYVIEDEQDHIHYTPQAALPLPAASFEMPLRNGWRGNAAAQIKWDRVNAMYLDRKNYSTRRSEDYCERCRRLGWPCMEKRDPTTRKACQTCHTQTCSSTQKPKSG